jgi:uncharacterized protein (UPF0303 family)
MQLNSAHKKLLSLKEKGQVLENPQIIQKKMEHVNEFEISEFS